VRRTATLVLLAGATSIVFADHGQVFRSGVQLVLADVSVMKGRALLTGLTAGDFEVTDNGAIQHIESIHDVSMPLDVSLVVDATWLTLGLVGGQIGPSGTRSLLDNARQLAALLGPDDRLSVITFSNTVEETRPMSPIGSAPDEISLANTTTWSLDERPRITRAVLTALTAPVAADRRHIVLAFSAARGALDAPSGKPLVEVAARADALLYGVLNPPVYDQAHVPYEFHPSEIPIRDAITRASEATGGKTSLTGDIVSTFRSVLKEFRQRYVLRYSLHGVPSRGWHNIVVKVPSCPSCTIQARRGYMGR
jgi:VWFA-related protein